MKKLLTVVFMMLLACSLAFAQDSSSGGTGKADKPAAGSNKKSSKTSKAHKGGKKGKKGSGGASSGGSTTPK